MKVFAFAVAYALFVPQCIAEPTFPADFPESAKKAFIEKYAPAAKNKAFAITEDGKQFYYVFNLPSPGRAARTASFRCLSAHGRPCLVWMVNDEALLSAYDKASEASTKAIANISVNVGRKSFAGEDTDMGVAVSSTLRDNRAGLSGATPIAPPAGSKLISTPELVRLYKMEPTLVVVDVLHEDQPKKLTLPKALWLEGAGWSEGGKDVLIYSNLSTVMRAIVPNENTPIATYCSGWECWLSRNTAARLVAMGYKQVYWYRGGLASWKEAKLPLVETPITGQLW